jgi:hypothetical protein
VTFGDLKRAVPKAPLPVEPLSGQRNQVGLRLLADSSDSFFKALRKPLKSVL